MTTQKTKRIPTPLYAAAGAGDLAYQQLRKLPEKVNQLNLPEKVTHLRGRVAEWRPTVTSVSETELRADLGRLRAAARRNANAVLQRAHVAGERAAVVYGDLVARGERVVRTMRSEGEADEAPAELEAPKAALTAAPGPAEAAGGKTEAPDGKADGKAAAAKPATRRGRPAAK